MKTIRIALASAATAAAVFSTTLNAQVFTNKEPDVTRTYLTAIGAPQAWARGITGRGSIIAIVDNGFALNHSDLRGNVLAYSNFYPGSTLSWGLHGTQMASIAAGAADGWGTVGVAPDARLLLAQVGYGGTTSGFSTAAMISAMTWAEGMGAHVINLSLGSTFDSNFRSGTVQIAPGIWRADPRYTSLYSNTTADLMRFAGATRNVVIVAAAGNQGLGYAQFPGAFATQVDSNGNLLLGGRVLIVGNVRSNGAGGWVIDPSSNRAGSLCTNLVNNVCRDRHYVRDFFVVAPGNQIWGAVPDEARTAAARAAGSTNGVGGVNGTSPSTALVSGGIALMRQAWPYLSASQIVNIVLNTATPLGDPNIYGRGMVNFDKATQPYGGLKYSVASLTADGTVEGRSLQGTGVAVSGNFGAALKSSTVLQTVQLVDGLNRNFTADFTRAVGANTATNSLQTSPYLSSQSRGYQEVSVPLNKDTVVTAMRSQQGSANQIETAYGAGRVSVQLGTLNERNGFLNNVGEGLFALGNSGTNYVQLGGSYPVSNLFDLVASYGMGVTKTSLAPGSLLSLSPSLTSDTWKLGLAKNEILFAGRVKDKLTLTAHAPVAVRRGYMNVSAVTDYTYTGVEEDVLAANPVVTSERINLATSRRQLDVVLGYAVNVRGTTYTGISVARQHNMAGIAGQNGYAIGATFYSAF